jgi:hypothetical protein
LDSIANPGGKIMLYPIKYLTEYQESPSQCIQQLYFRFMIHDFCRIKAKLESSDIKMDACSWPALLYQGHVADKAFNLTNIQNRLFEGTLVKCMNFFLIISTMMTNKLHALFKVTKHILTGPLLSTHWG